MLVSLVGEGSHSVIGKKLLPRLDPLRINFLALSWGVGFLTLALFIFQGLPHFENMTWASIGALLWLGPLATAGGYFYWLHAMKRLSLMSMALTLFVQPLAGSLFATGLLGEVLSVKQLAGGALILASILLLEYRSSATKTP